MFTINTVFDSSKPSTCVCTIFLSIIQNNSINEEITIVPRTELIMCSGKISCTDTQPN